MREYVFVREKYGDVAISQSKGDHYGTFKINNELSQATVYGKGAWVLHMMRFIVGDENFLKILKNYIAEYKWSATDISDFQRVAEETSNIELEWFFEQWIDSTALPDFWIDSAEVMREEEAYTTLIFLRQGKELVKTPVEITLVTPKERLKKKVWIDSQNQVVKIKSDSNPVFIDVDPEGWLLEKDKSNNRYVLRYPFNLYGLRLFLTNFAHGLS
jgi:aminopeptidase N